MGGWVGGCVGGCVGGWVGGCVGGLVGGWVGSLTHLSELHLGDRKFAESRHQF